MCSWSVQLISGLILTSWGTESLSAPFVLVIEHSSSHLFTVVGGCFKIRTAYFMKKLTFLYGEGLVLMKSEVLNLTTNTLHNNHLQVKLFRNKGLLHDTQQLPVPLG